MAERNLHAFLDVAIIDTVPQAIQHLAISDYISRLGGKLVFYSMENALTARTQSVLAAAMRKSPAVDGVVFFRLEQFATDHGLNLALMREMLAAGYSLHFLRERLSLETIAELDAARGVLTAFAFSRDRQREAGFMAEACAALKAFRAEATAA